MSVTNRTGINLEEMSSALRPSPIGTQITEQDDVYARFRLAIVS